LKFIENSSEFNALLYDYESADEIIAIPIPVDHKKHPIETKLSFVFLMLDSKCYILPFNHTDALCLNIGDLGILNRKDKPIYTLDKKQTYHLTGLNNLIDVNLLNYWNTGEKTKLDLHSDDIIRHYHMKHYEKTDINTSIPIMTFTSHLYKIATEMQVIVSKYPTPDILTYNNDMFDNFIYIEKNGLQTTDGVVYSEYNPFTATGRPSNRFGGINFAALNKSDGSRAKFISRFGGKGKLVEFDYDAYHLRLIADKVGYKFSDESVHQHFADLFDITYKEAKTLSFQYLYGFIPDEIAENIEYFGKVKDFTDKLWQLYKQENFIKSDIYSREIRGNNFNANKLFNYYIQLLETESNVLVIKDVRKLMGKYKSKLVLYSYDSFLFDMHIDDGLPLLTEIKEVLERGKYPVKAAWGNNYDELADITEKF
jgi:hypothetical protein|tara:strand:- start:154 stop:1431 length:1278 start_codon:yes stop_codon:yes gene_type:complete